MLIFFLQSEGVPFLLETEARCTTILGQLRQLTIPLLISVAEKLAPMPPKSRFSEFQTANNDHAPT